VFKRLKLTNFRQHEALEIEFSKGVCALRGANEAGKTTVIEAIAYAMFGSTALRESLDKVVTWGSKETALKVELDFESNGVLYSATRSKSGAEITFPGQRVTGQTETKKFVEGLLGVPADVVTKLMMANQAALRGTLEEGPTAAAALIETLANFDLIDRIVTLVIENLPSGNASALEAQVKMLGEQAEAARPAALDTEALDLTLADARAKVEHNRTTAETATTEWVAVREQADQVRADLQALQTLEAEQALLLAQVEKGTADAATWNTVSSVTQGALEALRVAAAAEAGYSAAAAAWRAVKGLKLPDLTWEGSRLSFDEELALGRLKLRELDTDRSQAYAAYQGALSRKINEQTCAFCKKDLSEVPEVALLNAEMDRQVAEQAGLLKQIDGALARYRETEAELGNLDRADRAFRAVYQSAAAFVQVTDDRVPAGYLWTGPEITDGDRPDYITQLRRAEVEVTRATVARGHKAATLAAVETAQARLAALLVQIVPLLYARGSDLPGLERDLRARVDQLRAERPVLDARVTAAVLAIANAQDQHLQAVTAHARIVGLLAAANQQLEELSLNNVLIKKLRAARPKVADELWSIVLSSVSHYFSQIRGVKSAVTRAEKGFQVDGHAVMGLSGSTLDALGMAIRVALTKTFLPNARFMILDEPGAACDTARESNMLGLIASSDFDQVLLVTHSDLADAFANQIINL